MGDIADWMIDQQIWREPTFDEYGEYLGHPRKLKSKKTATRVAEDLLDDRGGTMNKAKKLNDGVIKW